tara:strand:- start:753 stop:920 length:168 start_codon:yes stop_codon:yes gene_type:complete
MNLGSLVLWRLNPVFIGVILSEKQGSFSKKYEIYWFQEKKKIVNFEQDLILLSDT